MKRKMTCYVPFNVTNPYTMNVKHFLKEGGFDCISIKDAFKNPISFFKCKVFNFNWFERAENSIQYIYKSALLDFLKISGKKIIFTVHNKKPHESSKHDYSAKMMAKMCKKADVILGMCPETEEVIKSIAPGSENKLKYVLHPNYINNYKHVVPRNLRKELNFKTKDLVFLFIGAVYPYKNIEMLIDIFKSLELPNMKLLIAGRPSSNSYKNQLIERIGDSETISCDFRYIPDEDIPNYYQTADIVIMPYHKESSLNSGVVYLSFSLKRTVICPRIGTIKALADNSFVYDYDYSCEQEHYNNLKNSILRVYNDYLCTGDALVLKGEAAFEYVNKIHSDNKIRDMYYELYSELIG